jgi:DNA-binding NarL/FixJ family response regulator
MFVKMITNLPESDHRPGFSLTPFKVEPMKTKNGRSPTHNRILVVDNDEILGAGLENLLSNEESLKVWGVATQEESVLIDEIQRSQPDTVILIAESKLSNPTRLFTLLPGYGRLRIILVSIDSNILEIYDKQQITANNWLSLVTKLGPE